MHITKADIAAGRRALMARPRDRRADTLDFKIRPISEEWRFVGKAPAYKTAVANVAYIWRRTDAIDRFGPMPNHFTRAYDLRSCGLLLPRSAPKWAHADYTLWAEADEAAVATGDPTAITAWHLMAEIPGDTDLREWDRTVRDFLQRELADKGAPVAYAIHALRGDLGWLIKPHVHAIVAARHYRHDELHGIRHPVWLAGTAAQIRTARRWQHHWKWQRLASTVFAKPTSNLGKSLTSSTVC